jgi:hypothetical protein
MGDGMSSGFFKEETAKQNQNSNHCLGQIIPCLYFCGYAKFLEYTLGIRLGHFR